MTEITAIDILTKISRNSYNNFIEVHLPKILERTVLNVNKNQVNGEFKTQMKVSFFDSKDKDEIKLGEISVNPNEARLKGFTYSMPISTNMKIELIHNDERMIIPFENFNILDFPVMLHSKYCNLYSKSSVELVELGESPEERGGYFIIDGSEKIIVSQEDSKKNLITTNFKQCADYTEYSASLQSSVDDSKRPEMHRIFTKKDNAIMIKLPYFTREFPLVVVLRACGFDNDKEILKYICGNLETDLSKRIIDELKPSFKEAHGVPDQITAMKFMSFFSKQKASKDDNNVDTVFGNIYNLLSRFAAHQNNKTMYDSNELYLENLKEKGIYLCVAIRELLFVKFGLKEKTDREDIANKKVRLSGAIILEMFREYFEEFTKVSKLTIDSYIENNTSKINEMSIEELKNEITSNKLSFFNTKAFQENITKSFRSKWGKNPNSDRNKGIIQSFARHTFLESISHQRRIHAFIDDGLWTFDLRRLHPSQQGYVCSIEVPDGPGVGTSKHFAHTCIVSEEKDPHEIEKFIKSSNKCSKITETSKIFADDIVRIFINGKFIAVTEEPAILKGEIDKKKYDKKDGSIDEFCSVSWDIQNSTIDINMNGGRYLRPLVNTKKSKVTFTEQQKFASTPEFLLENGCEYFDPDEIKNILVKYNKSKDTKYKELTKTFQLGLSALTLPYLEHNPLARNRYACSQVRSAVSLYASNFKTRYDQSANLLHYGQTPITSTGYLNLLNNNNAPYGQNLIVAIATYNGFNQEDSVIMNKSAVMRGMFNSTYIKSHKFVEEINKDRDIGNIEIFNNEDQSYKKAKYNYSGIDKNGIIKAGTVLKENMVLVSARLKKGTDDYTDVSLVVEHPHHGEFIDKVYLSNTSPRIARVTTNQMRQPIHGDKFASRQAQKATVGLLLDTKDIPYTEDGVVPDILFNVHSFPSRMTIGLMYEFLSSLVGIKNGLVVNVSPFNNVKNIQKKFEEILGKQDKFSERKLYSPETGDVICENACFGNIFYKRLKQQAEDKMYSVGVDVNIDTITGQAKAGRAQGGGLKIGTMERDSLLASGISNFVKESFVEKGDKTTLSIIDENEGELYVETTKGFNLFKNELKGLGLKVLPML
jgi:DNA-directed RNA polymerase beta subunit